MRIAKTIAKSVLVNPEGRILVLRRNQDDDHGPGRVDFPGGGVEDGEDVIDAAVREIKEEVGLTVMPSDLHLGYAHTRSHDKHGDILTRHLYVGKIATADIRLSDEHDAYWWRRPNRALSDFRGTSWEEPLRFIIDNETF